MKLEAKLVIKNSQKISMTHELRHMICLLQLPSWELDQKIDDLIEKNIFIERKDTFSLNLKANNTFSVNGTNIENYKQPMTVKLSLQHQLSMLSLNKKEELIASVIIESLDSRGFLNESLLDISSFISFWSRVDTTQVDAVLKKVQKLEPTGIAARNLKECFLLQINQKQNLSIPKTQIKAVLNSIFENSTENNLKNIQNIKFKTNISQQNLNAIFAIIGKLDSSPGFSPDFLDWYPQFIVPDLIMLKKNEKWFVKLNNETAPMLQLNSLYVDYMKYRLKDCNKSIFVKKQYQLAQAVIKGLNYRYKTIQLVGALLIDNQKHFLMHDETQMKPLSMHEVASKVGVHLSTISRIVKNKYIQTPKGIYPLNYFFCAGFKKSKTSSIAIKEHIKNILNKELEASPISDLSIQKKLINMKIHIARRTVAKYRKALGYPSSQYRGINFK